MFFKFMAERKEIKSTAAAAAAGLVDVVFYFVFYFFYFTSFCYTLYECVFVQWCISTDMGYYSSTMEET